MYNTRVRGVLIKGNKSFADVSRDIIKPMDDKTPMWWWVTAFLATGALFWGVWGFYNTISTGIGEWGLNNNVAWGWPSSTLFGGSVSVTQGRPFLFSC